MHGPIGAKVSKPFARGYLDVLHLQLARGHVAEAGHAQHVAHRVRRADARRRAADHHRHLGFVLDAAGPGRDPDRVLGADDRRRGLEEHQRLGRQLLVHLRRVILVVEPDGDDDRRCDGRRPRQRLVAANLAAGPVVAKDVAAQPVEGLVPLEDVAATHALPCTIDSIHIGSCAAPSAARGHRGGRLLSSTRFDCPLTFCGVAESTATTAYTYRSPARTD